MFNEWFGYKKILVGIESESLFKETNQTNLEKKLREKGGNYITIMMKAVGFHFILNSHVKINLQNIRHDIRGQLEYEQFVCDLTALAECEGKPCPYTFILSDECLMQIALPYLQCRGGFVPLI